MKNFNEEIRRIREIMNLGESIQHNNFNQMGISRKTISRGGEPHRGTYEEQNAAPASTIETPRDIEIKGKIEINKEKEDARRREAKEEKERRRREEIEKYRNEAIKKQEKVTKEVEKQKEDIKKKEELEKILSRQRKERA